MQGEKIIIPAHGESGTIEVISFKEGVLICQDPGQLLKKDVYVHAEQAKDFIEAFLKIMQKS